MFIQLKTLRVEYMGKRLKRKGKGKQKNKMLQDPQDMALAASASSSAVHSPVDSDEEDAKVWFDSSPSFDNNITVVIEPDTPTKPLSKKLNVMKQESMLWLVIVKVFWTLWLISANSLSSTMQPSKRSSQLRRQLRLKRDSRFENGKQQSKNNLE